MNLYIVFMRLKAIGDKISDLILKGLISLNYWFL